MVGGLRGGVTVSGKFCIILQKNSIIRAGGIHCTDLLQFILVNTGADLCHLQGFGGSGNLFILADIKAVDIFLHSILIGF
jgi:hypothetical protein